MKRLTDKDMCITGDRGGKTIYSRLWMIENILGEDYDLDRLRDLMKVGRCSQCDNFSKKDSWCYPNETYMEETDFCSYFEPINHSNQ